MDKQSTILIVDDDPGTLNIMSLILQNAGYTVETDQYGSLSLNENPPDLILLDSNLGIMDGATICREIKSNERTKNIPVIMISAMHDIQRICAEANADNYLSKPFGINQLLSLIEDTLQKA